jgi:TolB-like protein
MGSEPRSAPDEGTPPAALRFGPFTLLPAEHRLLRDGAEVPLGSRAFDVLRALALRPGRLVTKDELLAEVWRGLVVEESNLHVQVSQLRKAVGADTIATVPGLGYRFVAPLRAEGPATAGPVGPARADARRLSVLVLPFVESAADAADAWFADAVTDDVIAQLSRLRGATVIASGTALAFRDEAVDWARAARELGVRYVLHGRIARDEDGIEVVARLSDAATRAVIWSDRFEVARSAIRRIRHELVARLAAALGLELLQAEARRLGTLAPASPVADELVMQALTVGGSNWSRDHYARAGELYERALAIEPDHAGARAGRALSRAIHALAWPDARIAARIAAAEADALRALAADSLEPNAHWALSVVRQQQYRLDAAIAAIDTAIELDPNAVGPIGWRGELLKFHLDTDAARAAHRRVLELSPRDPHRWGVLARLGIVEVVAGDPAAAVPWLERSFALQPYWLTRSFLLAAHASLGDAGRLRELRAQHAAGAAEQAEHNAWNRVSDQPGFLARMREHVFAPLVASGVLPDFAMADAWIARQRRHGVPG